jgi:NAD(P)-dependent dehydrogenase (short-subunit alcohol dehydrogenase family)
MGRLQDKVAIVTGSSSGLGRAIAIGYAKEGAKVVCSDLQKNAKKEGFENNIDQDTDQIIKDMGCESIFVMCDVTKNKEVEDLVLQAVKAFGRLDIMVNNAGLITRALPLDQLDDSDWDITMGVNGKGVWNGCQQAIRQFLKQGDGGKIVNIASIGGLVALHNCAAYCASKGAVVNLTRQLAGDYAPNNINVNGICPSQAATAINRPLIEDYPEDKQATVDATPMGRWVEVEEIVGPAIFLASSEANFITGQLLAVDGGYTCI